MKQHVGKKFLYLMLALINGSIMCHTVENKSITESDNSKENEKIYQQNCDHLFKRKDDCENKTHFRKRHWNGTNFIITDFLSDGEMERRFSLNGLAAKETSLGNNSKFLKLWQISDGKAFYQIIYSSENQIIDCEYVRQRRVVNHFLRKFYNEVDHAINRNRTSVYLPHRIHLSEHEFREFIENGVVDSDFNGLTPEIGNFLNFEDEIESRGLSNLTYTRIDDVHNLPNDVRQWLDMRQLKHKCMIRHRAMKKLALAMAGTDNDEINEAEEHLNRQKRSLADWFLAPNTKWCGRGNSAEKYNDLGGFSRADMCCRRHDFCKFAIKGMSTKWNLFNFRPYTISHCSCDLRFRTCLKMADSPDANMVGRVFFNVLQTKCFVLKREKVCKKRTWWGQCNKKGVRKRAHVRENRRF